VVKNNFTIMQLSDKKIKGINFLLRIIRNKTFAAFNYLYNFFPEQIIIFQFTNFLAKEIFSQDQEK